MQYEDQFLLSLILTLVIEIPVILFLVRYLYQDKRIGILKIVSGGVIASCLTLPYLWFIFPYYIRDWNTLFLIGESVIVCIEAIIYINYLEIKPLKAFTLSLIANAISVVIGLLIDI
ncbi:hypothetical protein MNSC_06860 [Minisyncoccus archaeophilus]|jgi:hypothetical protein|uniref:hypothetical protein n=1 Tax=Minisyncoccus archaeiphilus TaxID=3238481 RepID=UPI00399D31E8